jgi:LDH2 family malate/lactate/ureidoglycolate dehydrogenase
MLPQRKHGLRNPQRCSTSLHVAINPEFLVQSKQDDKMNRIVPQFRSSRSPRFKTVTLSSANDEHLESNECQWYDAAKPQGISTNRTKEKPNRRSQSR